MPSSRSGWDSRNSERLPPPEAGFSVTSTHTKHGERDEYETRRDGAGAPEAGVGAGSEAADGPRCVVARPPAAEVSQGPSKTWRCVRPEASHHEETQTAHRRLLVQRRF